MHGKGVVHRDMNPTNVFIVTNDDKDTIDIKILDFNVSKLVDEMHLVEDEDSKN